MITLQMQELKIQLKEFLDKGLIKFGVLPWGALVLFIKKENTMTLYRLPNA